jgi:hypothetical protein
MNVVKSLFGLCICLMVAGCAAGQKDQQVKEVCLSGIDGQRAMEISEQVLRDFNFSIAKEDPNTGYILTRPLAGSQFFEFWRKDNPDLIGTAESSLHSIRRTAELKISEVDQKLCINCNVRVQRLSLTGLPEESAGFKYDKITGQRIRTTSSSLDIDPKQMSWIELGSDNALEAAILKKIESVSLKK